MSQRSTPQDPGHPYAKTNHISFNFYKQKTSPAPFGYDYFISLPPSYQSESTKQYPLVLFLHGAGESQRGPNESYASIRHGVPKVILCYDKLQDGQSPPTIDIPQAPRLRSRPSKVTDLSNTPVDPEACRFLAENFITVTPSLNMDFGYGWNASVLSALMDEVVSDYRVDLDAVHVTGFSMGGYGTWALGMHSPQRFASLMPVCGGGDRVLARNITHLPQWIHHGDLDDIIPVGQSLQMEKALKHAGAKDVWLTRYPELKHDSWTACYGNTEVYEWMLKQRRKLKGDEIVVPEANKVAVAAAQAKGDGV